MPELTAVQAYQRAYREKNRERLAAQARAQYLRHREERLAKAAEYRKTHRPQIAEIARRYREEGRQPPNDPQKARDAARRRRAQVAGCAVTLISGRDWDRLVMRYRGLCAYCGVRPWEHRDHIVPVSRGGQHSIGNLLPACAPCNHSKNRKLLVEWRRTRADQAQRHLHPRRLAG